MLQTCVMPGSNYKIFIYFTLLYIIGNLSENMPEKLALVRHLRIAWHSQGQVRGSLRTVYPMPVVILPQVILRQVQSQTFIRSISVDHEEKVANVKALEPI